MAAVCLGGAGAALAQPRSVPEQPARLGARNGPALRCPPPRPARLSVAAQAAKGKADPPDVPKPRGQQGGREWLQSILSRFGPVKEKASNTTVLDFEKPLVELDNRIKEVRGRTTTPPCGRRRRRPGVPPRRSLTLPPADAAQVRQVAEENGVDVSSQIKELEERAKQVGCLCAAGGCRAPPAAPRGQPLLRWRCRARPARCREAAKGRLRMQWSAETPL